MFSLMHYSQKRLFSWFDPKHVRTVVEMYYPLWLYSQIFVASTATGANIQYKSFFFKSEAERSNGSLGRLVEVT
jgi:hypothetical protein